MTPDLLSFGRPLSILLVLTGCPAVVTAIDDDAGGAGAADTGGHGLGAQGAGEQGGDGAGGGPPVPRSIEVELLMPGRDQAELARIFVSSAEGQLKTSLHGASSPATVEVVDGDLVSFLDTHDGESPLMQSFRVTPDVDRIVASPEGTGWSVEPRCEPQLAMHLTVSVPAVAGASSYEIRAAGELANGDAPFTAELDPTVCAGETFNVFALAKAGFEVVSYQMIQDIVFEPGGTLHIDLELADTARQEVSVLVDDLDEVEGVAANAYWMLEDRSAAVDEHISVTVEDPRRSFLFAPQLIAAPGGYPVASVGATYPKLNGACRSAAITRSGGGSEQEDYHVGGLAEPLPAGSSSWSLADDGDRGDSLWVSWSFGEGLRWIVQEDPSRPPLSSVFPELGSDLPPGFSPPAGAPELYSIGIEEYDFLTGFADYARTPWGGETYTYRFRNYFPCD